MPKFFIILISLLAVFVLFVRYLEDNSLFYPVRPIAFWPDQVGLVYDDVMVETEDGIHINGWYVPRSGATHTVLFFHGNAGNLGDRLGKLQAFHKLGVHVFIIDYRGYGKSEGVPSEEGIYRDALAAYRYLREVRGSSSERIIVYGASLGGAVAVDLASKQLVGGLIIDSSFSSAVDVAKTLYPFVPGFLIRSQLDSVTKIKHVQAPKLFIHSKEDEIIPIRLGRKLYESAPPPKSFLEINGSHNIDQSAEGSLWFNGIRQFLRKYAGTTGEPV